MKIFLAYLMEHICPADVLLNGLDDKLYEINNKEDIDLIGPYQRAKKMKMLQDLLSLKGTIEIKNLSNPFIWLLSQDSSEQSHKHILHFKEIWNDFLIVLDVIETMGIECIDEEVSMIHHRVLDKLTDKFKFNDLEELAKDLEEEK